EVAEWLLEDLVPEDVEDTAAELLRLLCELLEQALEHFAFPGLDRDQVPHMAHLGLPDSVDASEALLDPIRVPREVVIAEEMGLLEVHPLRGSVGRHQHVHIRVLAELFLGFSPDLAMEATVDLDDCLRATDHRADAVGQVVQRVAMLREDDQLPACASLI